MRQGHWGPDPVVSLGILSRTAEPQSFESPSSLSVRRTVLHAPLSQAHPEKFKELEITAYLFVFYYRAVIRGARLRLVVNLGAAALLTGQEEGFTRRIPGTDFFIGGTPGPFVPLSPRVGVALFTTVSIPSQKQLSEPSETVGGMRKLESTSASLTLSLLA